MLKFLQYGPFDNGTIKKRLEAFEEEKDSDSMDNFKMLNTELNKKKGEYNEEDEKEGGKEEAKEVIREKGRFYLLHDAPIKEINEAFD